MDVTGLHLSSKFSANFSQILIKSTESNVIEHAFLPSTFTRILAVGRFVKLVLLISLCGAIIAL